MNIALIAHDKKKDAIIRFAQKYENILSKHNLFATGTTGGLVAGNTHLNIHRFLSGPMGGDQQIGAEVAAGRMDIVVFLRDPLTSQPHEPDISALLRLCDVHNIPLATNEGTATYIIEALEEVDGK